MLKLALSLLALTLSAPFGLAQEELRRPDLASSVIYEVNIRQYTPEGTFDAFRAHIPRLQSMGVDILWLMPIHPIGEKNRKGELGSYYSISDYYAVNTEFGTKEDLDELVSDAHDAGMLVILDWVANHTSWDHEWTRTHPERYRLNSNGAFTTPNGDWLDVIQLDMNNPDTRAAMKEAMLYWVREHDIDGYRCDVAEHVPNEFWRDAIGALRAEKPVFMLAEGGANWLFDGGFDATYGWGLGDACFRVVQEGRQAAIVMNYSRELAVFRRHIRNPFRMHFTSNHDWNSWNGTAVERLGDAWEGATVLSFMAPGMPLIYGGQEAGLDKQLEFFEKDEIEWRDHPAAELYRRLAAFKDRVHALDAGDPHAGMRAVPVSNPDRTVVFHRINGDSRVVVMVNLSPFETPIARPRTVDRYRDIDGNTAEYPDALGPWEWVVLEVVD